MTIMDDLALRAKANAHDLSDPERAAKALRRHTITIMKEADDAAANAATAERTVLRVPAHMADGIEIQSIHYTPDGAVTADDTNNATITFSKRNGAGGGATVVATATTSTAGTGNLVAHTPEEIPLSATLANRRLAAGEVLTELISKANSGVALAAGSFTVVFDEL